ncbi:MAG: polyphosphate kinase 1 [Treponema sp.]|nr:polyphosphate kinase 1 [Treponema sp.]
MENRFFNRELSWLEFNARVLFQALRKELPLLERLQFLSIVTSNFDEFFQVRVASVKRLLAEDPSSVDVSGLTSQLVLTSISARAHQIIRTQHNCLMNDILPKLAEKGYVYVSPQDYSPQQTEFLQGVFKNEIYPLLTPLRTDMEAFPHIKNLSTYAAFLLKPMEGIRGSHEDLKGSDDLPRIAFVEIPSGISNIFWLPAASPTEGKKIKKFALLQDVVTSCGTLLFPGFTVEQTLLFKVTRDADFAVDEDSGSNFIHAMEDVLIQRKSSFPVQMTCNSTSDELTSYLMEKLELSNDDVYKIDQIINPNDLMELRGVDDADKMSFEPWEHFYPADLPEDEPYWDTLKIRDKILHVPYECYDPVVKFISDAADDDNVLAIKMTLYRTGRDSPIIDALERAAQRGKQVTVLVELKARFDEERNIAWANELEQAGVTVIYGLKNLKVHAKILMVIRRESDTIRRYVHLATGNYNPKTAKLYSDISLFTSNSQIANDATLFFNLVTGYSTIQKMNCLGMAPVTIKSRILNMIQREIERSTSEQPGLIIAKMNSLTHKEVISALYKASQAGVKVLLNIRGICMLVPGVPGLSENIKVVSIVDRYLEHSRIFYFQNAGNPELYCSSADWMSRNLDRRIELMFPILEKAAFDDVKSILDSYFADNTNAMELKQNGSWEPVSQESDSTEKYQAQAELYKKYKKLNESKPKNLDNQFEVRRK